MTSKEYFEDAVNAAPNEIDDLNQYLFNRPVTVRQFVKVPPQPKTQTQPTTPTQHPPFHYLRTDLSLLLGASGTKLLSRTWCKFNLRPTDTSAQRLRPALVKLFSVAARIAATKGVGPALQRLVGDFERLYFPIVVDPENDQTRRQARRFALLSVLQDGQGDHLLHQVLGGGQDPAAEESLPSRHLSEQPHVARRLFLFEAAHRSKSWSEAYRQARLARTSTISNKRKIEDTYEGLLRSRETPLSKKKQVLTDLAHYSKHATDMALKASLCPAPICRPGELESLLCEVVSPCDPWWRTGIARLYRHRSVPERWMPDLRKLWQTEPSLRNFCKVLFNLIRYSKPRAEASLAKYGMNHALQSPGREESRHLLERVRSAVAEWLQLAPPASPLPEQSGALVRISSELWGFIAEVCGKLDLEVPVYCRANFQPQPALVKGWRSGRFLSLSPEFLVSSPQEQRVLLARAIFREAAGLDRLEERIHELHHPQQALKRATAYAEWSGHNYDVLETLQIDEQTSESALVVLEEMYWHTADENYRKLATLVHQGCWCPLFEREADLFASSYADLVNASHAIIKAELWGDELGSACVRHGLSALGHSQDVPRTLCLRLQNLWLARAESVQRELLTR